MNIAEYISEYLASKNISHVFGVSGANIEDLFESIYRINKTSIILAKSEYSASAMAIGSYLSTRKPGVVLTTSGPGILNTIPILAEAFTSKIPMILISGVVPLEAEGIGAFQDTSGKGESFDILKMLTSCSCYQIKIQDINEISKSLEMAFEYSMKFKKPAVILIPKDFFKKEIPDVLVSENCVKEINNDANTLVVDNAILFCEKFLKDEEVPPLIVLGEELVHLDNMSSILEFIQKTGAGVALTPNSKGLFNNSSPQFLGLVGVMGHEEVNDYLRKTNNVILIGTNLDLLNRYGFIELLHSKDLLVIKEERSLSLFKIEGNSLCEIYGNVNEIITKISSSIVLAKDPFVKELKFNLNPSGYNLRNIIAEIQTTLGEEVNIFVDAGNTGAFVIHHMQAKGDGIFNVSLGMGGMGNSIGAGIGSAVASGKKTYVFLGDGSFLMYGLEIHTAKEYNLPVTFFILNNNSHGMCTTRENVFLNGSTGINNFNKSYYAEGIDKIFPGVITHEVDDMEKLKTSLEDVIHRMSPCVVSINIPNTDDPPFRTFIKN